MGEQKSRKKPRLEAVRLAIPGALLASTLLGPAAPRMRAPELVAATSTGESVPDTVVAALVLPRLSLDCVVAVVDAIRTCSGPAPAGAVACGMALVRILHACP
jgi:hypothetical protein